MNSRIFSIAAFLLLSLGLQAQPQPQGQGRPHERPKMKTPAELAQDKVDMMNAEVNLTEKQYKKCYKLFKKDFEYREDAMQPPTGDMPMGGPGGGRPPMGGGPGGGGMPPMGGGPGGGFGGPGGGFGGPGGPGGFNGAPPFNVVDDEYIEQQDKKLRKILTDEQYNKWRSKHPMERAELPPIDLF